jgi:hypothetical protein
MGDVTNWLANLNLSDPVLWVVLAALLGIVLIFLLMGRRPRRPATLVIAPPKPAEPIDGADDWGPSTQRPDERRRSFRRSGVPTAVLISEPGRPKQIFDGYVLDRSSGGLRLAMGSPISTGVTLQIRATNAPSESPWIPITIRSCREVGDYFEVGVQFQEELPWSLLLMFG